MNPTDKRVAEKLAAFENEKESAVLQDALKIIQAAGHESTAGDVDAQTAQISRWMRFFDALDRHIDPRWDPDEVPETGIIPPPADGIAHFSGAAPAAIADPPARAQYEQALKASKDYAERYRIQHELRRIDDRAMDTIGDWLSGQYAGSAARHREFIEALSTAQVSEERKERLQALVPKPQ